MKWHNFKIQINKEYYEVPNVSMLAHLILYCFEVSMPFKC